MMGANDDGIDCRVAALEAASEDVRILTLEPVTPDLFQWRAGQYATLILDGFEARNYSIANAPGRGVLEFHIRRSGRGGFSDHCCDGLSVGDHIRVDGAYGAAFFREKHAGPVLAIAGGTGLAPMKAVCEAALDHMDDRDVHLYFGVTSVHELYLERHFIDMMRAHPNFRFVAVVQDPDGADGRRRGLVGTAVAADFQLLYGHQVYLGGPPAMVEACVRMLKLKSVPDHDIFSDGLT